MSKTNNLPLQSLPGSMAIGNLRHIFLLLGVGFLFPASNLWAADVTPVSNTASLAAYSTDAELNGSPLEDRAIAYLKQLTVSDRSKARATAGLDIESGQTSLNLKESVAFALANNFEVRAADEKSNAARYDKIAAMLGYLPSIALTADDGTERSAPAAINDSNGNRVLDSTHGRRDNGFTIQQAIIDLGIVADIRTGIDKEHLANSDRTDVREGVAFDTVSAYLGLIQSRIAMYLADDYGQYLGELGDRMKSRVDNGGGTSADLDRIRSRITVAESARVESQGEYQTNLAEFKRLTGLAPADITIPEKLAPVITENGEEAVDIALASNPSYIGSIKKIELAVDDQKKAIAGLLPRLTLQYTSNYSYNAGGAAVGNPVDGIYPSQETSSLMLVGQWTLAGPSFASMKSSVAKENEMRLHSMELRSRIEQGIAAGYTARNAAQKREAFLLKNVAANERVVAGFNEQFQNGYRSLFDLLDAYEQLYSSRLNLARVTVASAKAAYQIQRQMGQLIASVLATTGN